MMRIVQVALSTGLGNDPTARILKLLRTYLHTGWRSGLGNDPTARILKRRCSARSSLNSNGLGNDPTARILKRFLACGEPGCKVV